MFVLDFKLSIRADVMLCCVRLGQYNLLFLLQVFLFSNPTEKASVNSLACGFFLIYLEIWAIC